MGADDDEFHNPVNDTFESEPRGPSGNADAVAVATTADLDQTLSTDELSDLTFAFQALDVNRNGTIEPLELHAMMAVLGAEVEMDVVRELFRRTKVEFHAWLQREEEKLLPDRMDYRNKEQAKRPVLHIPWRNKMANNNAIAVATHKGRNPIIGPVADIVGSSADKLLNVSSTVVKGAASKIGFGESAEDRKERLRLSELEADPDAMIFAEYTHMMESRFLMEQLVPGDWHKRAGIMRDLRRAYDVADVDGNDAVEFDEFEMVITALNPLHGLSHDDVLYLWQVMLAASPEETRAHGHARGRTPSQASESMNFLDYLHGMAAVQKDPRAAGWLDVEQPNKWELLCLLVDTPVSKAEEHKLLEDLTGLERMGINMLKNDQRPMDKDNMRAVLKRAGEGRLRDLNPEQVSRMRSLKTTGWLLSGLIGFIFTIVPCAVENYLVADIGIDGVKDRFDVCQPFSVIRWDGNSSSA